MPLFNARVTGQLPSGEEHQHGFWTIRPTGENSDPALEASQVAQAYLDNWTAVSGAFHVGYTLDQVTVYRVDEATGDSIDAGVANIGLAGTHSGTNPLPPQIATVVSLRTPLVGRSRRGRLYLGGQAATHLTATGRLEPAAQGLIADFVEDLFEQVNLALDARRVCVYSRVLRTTANVTSIAVGDVFDTQRRRRNGLDESVTVREVSA